MSTPRYRKAPNEEYALLFLLSGSLREKNVFGIHCLRNHSWVQTAEGKALLTPTALLECLLSAPPMQDVGTGASQQELTANCACGSIRKMKLDVYTSEDDTTYHSISIS